MATYPAYVRTDEDRAAYDKAREEGWTRWVHNASDILAIQVGCWFDLDAAERVEQFFLLLPQSKGKWAGKPLVLTDYQRDEIIYPLFGWKRPDGTRRYRKGFIFIPKKNGKSTLGAAIALYLLIADEEAGPEVYTAAADKSNAMNVMGEAISMVHKCPALKKRLQCLPGIKRINRKDLGGFFAALSSDAASAEGKNIHGLIFDELHSQASRDLWRALQGGGVAREQPLFLAITTAGQSTETLCYTEYEYAKRVIAGTEDDWTYFAFIAEADPKDDPGSEETWKKANPSLGISPTVQALADLWKKAKGSPEDENDFKQYHLNLWVQKATSAIPLTAWDLGGEPFDPEELIGRPCWGGLDLGAVSDLTAFSLLFPDEESDEIKVVSWFWCPKDRSKDRGQKKVSYLKWLDKGWLRGTEGNVTDYDVVRADINRICSNFEVKGIATDTNFQGRQLESQLLSDGLPVVSYGNNASTMCEPTRQFLELVLSGKLKHGGNPVLRWMAGNLVMKKVGQGSMYPDKDKSHEKIDGCVSIIMAMGLRTVKELGGGGQSHYEDNSLMVLPSF